MTYKDVVKEVVSKKLVYDLAGNTDLWKPAEYNKFLVPSETCLTRIHALCQLMMIADYYNSKRHEKNDSWEICWNTRRQKYELVSWGECRYGGVRFFCKKDAEEVMNNPEFDKILSSVLKHS